MFETIKHHGIFHTVLTVTILAAVVGPVIGTLLEWMADKTGLGFGREYR